jgi:hypothetical protein
MERTGNDGQEGRQLNIVNVKDMFECRVFRRKVTDHLRHSTESRCSMPQRELSGYG